MKPKDTKHLQLRFNKYWLYYRLPKRLKDHPKFENHPSIITKSLGTDSLSKAKQLRDKIIYELHQHTDDSFEAWETIHAHRALEFTTSNPHLLPDKGDLTYDELVLDSIINDSIVKYGVDPETGNPLKISDKDQFTLDVLNKSRPDRTKMLRYITKKVLAERKADNQASKTLLKIRRSTDWFMEHIVEDDINIALIDYDQVHDFIVTDKNNGVAGSTLNGHMYGLSQIWERAKKSKIVKGDNPFSSHGISKESESYSPFSNEEVHALYNIADDEMKVLIHAAFTTGARLNELLTAEVKIPSSFDSPCWLFKFKDKGKTAQSTRAVPIHSSLSLPEGFAFSLTDRTVTRRMKELKNRAIINNNDECTGKPRKLSFHSFRTTLITELVVRQGISEKVVGAITGHLAGSVKIGSITSYINTDDLALKRQTVEKIFWK